MRVNKPMRSEIERAFRFYTRAVLEAVEEEIPMHSKAYPRIRTKVMDSLGLRGLEAEVKRSIYEYSGGAHGEQ